jgi:predicted ATPase
VAEALGSALGLPPETAGKLDRVVNHLRHQRHLIVLDTCEAATEGAARVTEALFAEAPNVRLLTTSREALRAVGEWVYRIEPLAAPASGAGLSAEEALRYPAVQLFVHRAAANHAGFALRDEDVPLVSAICRDLDGMALAIELAAGRVDAYGVRQVADLLSTEFALTWPGRRTAPPRQQTLNATINWSHELLSDTERAVFRRLAAFVGAFSLEAAQSIAADGEISPAAIIEALASLVAKSLVNAESDGLRGRYRMLDTTRAYARGKLAASAEEAAVWLRHARHYLDQLQTDASGNAPLNPEETSINVRVALERAFGPDGDPTVGLRLAAAASPFWLRHGLVVDSRRWSREALVDLDRRSHPRDEIDAHITLVSALTHTEGLTPEIHRNWAKAFESAKREGRREHELTGLFVLWGHEMRNARYQAAQALLDGADVLEAAGADAAHRAMADWMVGRSAHCRGDHRLARERLEHLVGEFTEAAGRPVLNLFGYDLESAAYSILGLTHLLLGNFDQARTASDRAIAKAQALGYPLPLASALLWRAFLLYFLDEDPHEADSLTRRVIESARANSMDGPLAMALAFRGLWLARSGDVLRGTETTLEGLRRCAAMNYFRLQPLVRAELALQIVRHADRGAGPAVDVDLHDEADPETWCTPGILRVKGEIAERTGDARAAEALYRDALTLAERHGALTWQLRAANGLAGLWIAQKRPADAAELLAPIVNRFAPSADQPDLRVAAHHLEACRRAPAA